MGFKSIPPADEERVFTYLARGGEAYGGGGMPHKVAAVYRAFGSVACKKRFMLLENAGMIRLYGAGRNRQVRLTPSGMRAART